MKYLVRINNKEYEVEVERGRANLVKTTEVESVPAPEQPAPLPAVPAAPAAGAAPRTAGGEPIEAPMPGTVLEVKAGAGTSVKKGDVVLILEAMKMENEIRAPRDGKVSQVVVSKGASVSTDDILMVLQ